jgi:hypothetical protein
MKAKAYAEATTRHISPKNMGFYILIASLAVLKVSKSLSNASGRRMRMKVSTADPAEVLFSQLV